MVEREGDRFWKENCRRYPWSEAARLVAGMRKFLVLLQVHLCQNGKKGEERRYFYFFNIFLLGEVGDGKFNKSIVVGGDDNDKPTLTLAAVVKNKKIMRKDQKR